MPDRQLFTQLEHVSRTFSRHAADIWSTSFRPDLQPRVVGHLLEEQCTPQAAPRYAYAICHPHPDQLGTITPVSLPRELDLPPVYRIESGPAIDQLADEPFYDIDKNGVILYNYGAGRTFDPSNWLLSRVDVH